MTLPGDIDEENPSRRRSEPRDGGDSKALGSGAQGERPQIRDPKKDEAARRKELFNKHVIASFSELYPAYTLAGIQFKLEGSSQLQMTLVVGQRELPNPNGPEGLITDSGSTERAASRPGKLDPPGPNPAAGSAPKLLLTSLAGLVLSAIAVVLLILLLFKPGPAPPVAAADPGELKPIAESIKAESKKLAETAGKLQGKVEGIEKALERMGSSGPQLPKNFAAEVAGKVSIPIGVKAEDLQKVTQTLEALKGEVARIADVAKNAKPAPSLLPDSYWDDLSQKMSAAVAKALPKPPPPPSARDTYLVITHGAAMDANRYIGSLRETLTKLTARGPDVPVRVGLALASTDRITGFVSLTEPSVNLKAFGDPNPDSSEAPHMFGGKIKRLFPAGRLDQRAILLVSDQADAPAVDKVEDMDGWNDLGRVDVLVLAAKDPKDFSKEDWKKYAKWCDFVEACHGSVQIIGHHAVEPRQNDLLREALRRLISQAE